VTLCGRPLETNIHQLVSAWHKTILKAAMSTQLPSRMRKKQQFLGVKIGRNN
jgi:hypothetical protein